MKRVVGIGLVVVLLGIAAVVSAEPWQGRKGGGGWCREEGAGPGRMMYDPAKAETVAGEVAAVEQFSGGRRMGQGVGLKLKTPAETLLVHLGPQWFIEQQGEMSIKAGDKVEVKGVKTVRRGQDVFIAGEVKKGSEVLKLRDEKGIPLWAGWKRGTPGPQ